MSINKVVRKKYRTFALSKLERVNPKAARDCGSDQRQSGQRYDNFGKLGTKSDLLPCLDVPN